MRSYWLWGGLAALAVFLIWRARRNGGAGYTASDVANLGTVAPGANIFADTGGAIGYGVPSSPGATPETSAAISFGTPDVSRWLTDFAVLGSGPDRTSPGAAEPVASRIDWLALGYGNTAAAQPVLTQSALTAAAPAPATMTDTERTDYVNAWASILQREGSEAFKAKYM